MLGPVPEVDDVIQDVFFQVYRSIGDFRGSARFSTWLHRVAINVVLMHLRAQRSRPNLSDPLSHDLKAVGPSPDEETMRRERIRTFYGVLDRLSEKKRIVFVLHEIEGLSPRAIADIVGAPALTVRTRLHYARRELISLLRNEPSLAALADVMVRPGSTDVTATCEAQST
ncbi:MAG: sigma-70 family RNA polymerase sigma factor [Polyangiaceae bacterium]|jgi:RNA polymerase sigma-70 factor (ECF subfamily)|nr:sigma-70 family RNA polymerase sigma factor [Polyangiaceae bacterium]